jgi:hypothetical protein
MAIGFQITVNIAWSQKERQVLDYIHSSFGGTIVYNKVTCSYSLTIKRQDTIGLLLSIFTTNPLRGVKQLDFMDACRVYSMITQGVHLTTLGLILIRVIYLGMNQRRPLTRTLSHQELYSLFATPLPKAESFFINLPSVPKSKPAVKVKATRKVKSSVKIK